jgi:hypothetical protein
MSKKYGTSHHNFGPYPDENADVVHEGLGGSLVASVQLNKTRV